MKLRHLVIALGVLTLVITSACGASLGGGASEQRAKLPADAPIYLVLDDLASRNTSGSAERVKAFRVILQAAYERHARLLLASASSTPDSVRIVFDRPAVAQGANELIGRLSVQEAMNSLTSQFRQIDARAVSGRSNVLGALRVLAANLHVPGDRQVDALVMSSGIQGIEPLELAAHAAYLNDPDAAVRSLRSSHLLPQLRNWRITFLSQGIGSDEQFQALSALWWRLIAATGGEMGGFQGAVLSWPLPAIVAPQVPRVVPIPVSPNTTVVRLPDHVLFDVDRATLRPTAQVLIAQIASLLTHRYAGDNARVIGYADSTGSPSWNLTLSRRRARSVASAVAAHGVAPNRLAVSGRGASGFVATNSTALGRQMNRRVEIIIRSP